MEGQRSCFGSACIGFGGCTTIRGVISGPLPSDCVDKALLLERTGSLVGLLSTRPVRDAVLPSIEAPAPFTASPRPHW